MAELLGGTTIAGYTAIHSGLPVVNLSGDIFVNGNKVFHEGNLVAAGSLTQDFSARNLTLGGTVSGNQTGGALRVQTPSGTIDIGCQNTSWGHIMTDRTVFYFNKGIRTEGGAFSSVSGNLLLQTAGTTRVTVNTAGNVAAASFTATGNIQAASFTAQGRIDCTHASARLVLPVGVDRFAT